MAWLRTQPPRADPLALHGHSLFNVPGPQQRPKRHLEYVTGGKENAMSACFAEAGRKQQKTSGLDAARRVPSALPARPEQPSLQRQDSRERSRERALKMSSEPSHPLLMTPDASKDLAAERCKYEDFVARFERGDRTSRDPLKVWRSYVDWTAKHFPKEEKVILERACKALSKDERYYDNEDYLRLWVLFAAYQKDTPQDTFKHLDNLGIGVTQPLLYEAWAQVLEKARLFDEAHRVYRLGIGRGVHSQGRLRLRLQQSEAEAEELRRRQASRRRELLASRPLAVERVQEQQPPSRKRPAEAPPAFGGSSQGSVIAKRPRFASEALTSAATHRELWEQIGNATASAAAPGVAVQPRATERLLEEGRQDLTKQGISKSNSEDSDYVLPAVLPWHVPLSETTRVAQESSARSAAPATTLFPGVPAQRPAERHQAEPKKSDTAAAGDSDYALPTVLPWLAPVQATPSAAPQEQKPEDVADKTAVVRAGMESLGEQLLGMARDDEELACEEARSGEKEKTAQAPAAAASSGGGWSLKRLFTGWMR